MVQAFLVLRTLAVWGYNRKVKIFLIIGFLEKIVSMTAALVADQYLIRELGYLHERVLTLRRLQHLRCTRQLSGLKPPLTETCI